MSCKDFSCLEQRRRRAGFDLTVRAALQRCCLRAVSLATLSAASLAALSAPVEGMAPSARLVSRDLAGVAKFMASDACERVVVLTGAGVSCAAGIPDFRSPGGMYDTLRPELITATPQERALMAADPVNVVVKDMFMKNQFPSLAAWRRLSVLGPALQKSVGTARLFESQVPRGAAAVHPGDAGEEMEGDALPSLLGSP